MKLIDLTNQKINMLTVIRRIPNKNKHTCWLCQCECGNFREAFAINLINKEAYSCGCVRKPVNRKPKYDIHNKKIYTTWNCMKSRCYYKKDKEYKHYGDRNIKICNKWLGKNGYKNFEKWALKNGFDDKLTIDRIDNNGNYEPNNCRWVTRRENNLNRRGIILIDYEGKKICLKDYCKIKNINYDIAKRKRKKGINVWEIN